MEEPLRRTLANGLRVEVSRVDDANGPPEGSIQCHLVVGSGSTADPRGKSGLAHVVEHVARRRIREVKQWWAPKMQQAFAEGRFLYGTATTELEFTYYPFSAPPSLFVEAFDFFAQWLSTISARDASYVAGCVSDVSAEIHEKTSENLLTLPISALYGEAYGRHPYGRRPLGEVQEIGKITADDCERFLDAHYTVDNLLFSCVVGRAPELKIVDVLGAVERSFSGLKLRQGPKPTPVSVDRREGFRASVLRSPGGPAFLLGIKVDPADQVRQGHLRLLVNILFSGAFPKGGKLRMKLKALGCTYPMVRRRGLLELIILPGDSVSIRPDEILEALFRVCSRLSVGTFDRDQVENSRTRSLDEWQRSRKSRIYLEQLAQFQALGYGALEVSRIGKQIQNATHEDLSKLAGRLLESERMSCVYSG